MNNKSGFTLVEVLVSIGIIILLFGIGVPSYLMISKNVKQGSYDNKVSWVLTKAESWAADTGLDATNIAHLIEEGYLEADNEYGAFNSPIDNSSMLCYVIRIDYDNNQYSAYLTGEEYCDYLELQQQASIFELIKIDGDKVIAENEWTRNDITLKLQFKKEEDYEKYHNYVEEIQWRGNSQIESVEVHNNFDSKNTRFVQASQLINTRYEATIKINYEGKKLIYKTYTQIKIDRQNPIIYQGDLSVDHFDDWVNTSKKAHIVTSDYNGSGVYGYYINNQGATCSTNKADYTQIDSLNFDISLNQGEYHVCVIDNVGNLSESAKINIINIDNIPPTVSVTLNGKTANLQLKDNIAVAGYYISKDSNVPSSWILTNKQPSVSVSEQLRSPGTYYVYAIDQANNIGMTQFYISPAAFCSYPLGQVWSYNHTGGQQIFTVPCDGYYYITVNGPSGGEQKLPGDDIIGSGKGSTRGGRLYLTAGTPLYVYVGGTGESGGRRSHGSPGGSKGGFNGGADADYDERDLGNHGRYWTHGSGGGATDVRMGGNGIGNQIIVAGGGGGANKSTSGKNADGGCYNGRRLNGTSEGGGGGYYGGSAHCGGSSYVSGIFSNVISQNGNSTTGHVYFQLQDF